MHRVSISSQSFIPATGTFEQRSTAFALLSADRPSRCRTAKRT
ncbi:unnamed protein product [Soboliphyme baturini]|uniref:Uncharacterized protein n=1 Tax=Soboliphyme baturini TaxID=241478 RepID=A0A183IHR8_9BILA|nr:unnamed protein product [Soboliphyme baturini]